MEKKYQVFISSTYEDLTKERKAVIQAVLEMGHIPVGMEMFSAGDEEQWKIIQKQIDDCDYYIVIVAFRYGSLDGDISYTEKEYDYAKSVGIPTLGFVIKPKTSWQEDFVDKDAVKVKKLDEFKGKIKSKLINFWSNSDDLHSKVSIALMKQFNTNPQKGWVRYSKGGGEEVLKEVSRLSKENAELRNKIEALNQEKIEDEQEEIKQLIKVIKQNKKRLPFFYEDSDEWEDHSEISLFEIFNVLAPEMQIEYTVNDCIFLIAFLFKKDKKRNLRANSPCPTNRINEVLTDLSILELIMPSKIKHKVGDQNKYWSITEKGKKV